MLCSNYRPISLLSNIGKIIEKIMYNGIYKFRDINKLKYSLKFGFRQHYSTSLALESLTGSMMKALDDGNFACVTLLTFKRLLIVWIIAFC